MPPGSDGPAAKPSIAYDLKARDPRPRASTIISDQFNDFDIIHLVRNKYVLSIQLRHTLIAR